MEVNWRALTLTFFLAPLFTGCEQLGLEDDEEQKRDSQTEPELPEVEITDPQVAFPFTRFLYFIGEDNADISDPKTYIYSYEIATNSVVRQSSGQSARVLSTEVPLGKSRFTQSYALIEENGNYFRASPEIQNLVQLGTLSNGNKTPCAEQFLADGLGLANHQFQVRSPGTDDTCNSSDDIKQRISLGAGTSSSPANISANLFSSLPLQNATFEIQGYLRPNGADSVQLIKSDLTVVHSFTGLSSNDFSISRLDSESTLLLDISGNLYTGTAEQLTDGTIDLSTPLTQINATSLIAQNWEIDGTSLYLIDGNNLRMIDLDSGSNMMLATGGTVEGRLVQTDDSLFYRLDTGDLHKVSKADWSDSLILGTTVNKFMTEDNLLYFNTKVASDSRAYVADLAAASLDCSAPLDCNGLADAGACLLEDAANACLEFTDAQWTFVRENLDRGVETYPVLMQGVEDLVAPHDAVEGDYFSKPVFYGYQADSAERLVEIGSIIGQVKLVQTGVSEQGHALLEAESDPTNNADADGQYSDIYYFNTRRSSSMKSITSSISIDEALMTVTELD